MKKYLPFLLFLASSSVLAAVPLNFGDLMTISKDSRFQSRVQYCMNVAAVNVMAEAANTADHAVRVVYARQVLNGFAPSSLYADILTNATIAAEATTVGPDFAIPDSDIQFTVNSLFNSLAGVAN